MLGYKVHGVWLPLAALSALLLVRPSAGADETAALAIAHTSLVAYPEADCTKLHVYVRNDGRWPVLVESVQVGERVLDLDPAKASPGGGLKTHSDQGAPRRTDGHLQWRRALPNPVPPGAVADVTVSFWGAVKEVPVRVRTREGQVLECLAKETPEQLRLSQIAFDPSDPNTLYVYCENRTEKDVSVDHLLVNTEKVETFKSIPAGGSITGGGKSCFIVQPKRKLTWGGYVGIGLAGTGGEKVLAVVRAVNLFPVGSWDGDTRAETFFDSADMHKPMPKGDAAAVIGDPLAVSLDGVLGRPFKACYDGGNPFRVGASWEDNARKIIRDMATLHSRDGSTPFYTHFGLPITEAYAFFGGLPDLAFMNPYTVLFRATGPEESGRLLRLARTWTDPRPVVSIPEAFADSAKPGRDLTPDEVSFAAWNEIAEGAKGVRYYRRRVNPPGRGYADMPGVEARIARDALDLQLLKPFLRVGDTFGSARCEKDSVLCKTVMCADKGIAVIALNRDYTGRAETPSQWRRVDGVQMSVAVPAGQRVTQAFEVNQGFQPVEFSRGDGRVEFSIPSIHAVRRYLLLFERTGETARTTIAAPVPGNASDNGLHAQPSANAESLLQFMTQYRLEASRIALPLLEPGLQMDDARVVGIGLDLNALKESARQRLATVKARVDALDARKREDVRAALGAAYEALGEAME